MQTIKLNRLLHSVDHGGFYRSPLAILIADVGYRDRPRIVAMLYIKDAVRDNSSEALHKLADSAYVSDCYWYPEAISTTIGGALRELENQVNRIKGDKKSMNDWFLDLYHVQFNLTKHFEETTEYMIDIEDLKLTARPNYCIDRSPK